MVAALESSRNSLFDSPGYSGQGLCEGTGTENNSGIMTIYPNPSAGLVTVDLTLFGHEVEEVIVFNRLSQEIQKRNDIDGEVAFLTFDLSKELPGLYLIAVFGKDITRVRKVILAPQD
jgi:hypothetical protein